MGKGVDREKMIMKRIVYDYHNHICNSLPSIHDGFTSSSSVYRAYTSIVALYSRPLKARNVMCIYSSSSSSSPSGSSSSSSSSSSTAAAVFAAGLAFGTFFGTSSSSSSSSSSPSTSSSSPSVLTFLRLVFGGARWR